MSSEYDDWINGPVEGPYRKLATRIRSITGKVASRVAARRSGLSHDTMNRLWNGDRVSEAYLLRFAIGYGVDANELLELAGLPALSERERQETYKYIANEGNAGILTDVPELLTVIKDYMALPVPARSHVLEHFQFVTASTRKFLAEIEASEERVIVDLSDEDDKQYTLPSDTSSKDN